MMPKIVRSTKIVARLCTQAHTCSARASLTIVRKQLISSKMMTNYLFAESVCFSNWLIVRHRRLFMMRIMPIYEALRDTNQVGIRHSCIGAFSLRRLHHLTIAMEMVSLQQIQKIVFNWHKSHFIVSAARMYCHRTITIELHILEQCCRAEKRNMQSLAVRLLFVVHILHIAMICKYPFTFRILIRITRELHAQLSYIAESECHEPSVNFNVMSLFVCTT